MLKLNYTEDGLHMEQLAAPLEVVVTQRIILALRAAQTLHVEPGRASFLIANHVVGVAHLQTELRGTQDTEVKLTAVDEDFVEVSLHGRWIAESPWVHEGIFLVALPNRLEYFVYKLWQATQAQAISLS